jgi:AcrR family transcriptional regulator
VAGEGTVTGKRERTRARLLGCALDLFERQGFDATTVAQIAAAAGVTPMTLFRYFPSKEQLLLDDPYDPFIAAAVAAQPRALSPLVRVARGIRVAWSQVPEPDSEIVRRRVRISALTPSLRAGVARNGAQTEQLIAATLAADGATTLVARACAAAAMAAVTAALFEWAVQPDLSLAEAVMAALDLLEGINDGARVS